MELTVGCNWDPALVDALAAVPEVRTLAAALPLQPVGTDRPVARHPAATREDVEAYVRRTHAAGLRMTFLLNAPSIGGREFAPARRREILEYVAWLDGIGVDGVSVSSPGVLELVRARFPSLRISVYTHAGVSRPDQLRTLADLGASEVCLSRTHNRDLPALRRMVRVPVPVALTCLSLCPVSCPNRVSQYHLSITTSLNTRGRTTGPDNRHGHFHNISFCHGVRLQSPRALLTGCFLRPEDLPVVMAGTGVTRFQLDTRLLPTHAIVEAARAYAACRYDGDVKRLVSVIHFSRSSPGGLAGQQRSMGGDATVAEVRSTVPALADVVDFDRVLEWDNRATDGFFEELAGRPSCVTCEDCDLCERYSRKAMRFDAPLARDVVQLLRRYRDSNLDRG